MAAPVHRRPPATPAPPPAPEPEPWIAVKNTGGEFSFVKRDAIRAVIGRSDANHVIVDGGGEVLTYEPTASIMERVRRGMPFRSEDERRLAERRSQLPGQDTDESRA